MILASCPWKTQKRVKTKGSTSIFSLVECSVVCYLTECSKSSKIFPETDAYTPTHVHTSVVFLWALKSSSQSLLLYSQSEFLNSGLQGALLTGDLSNSYMLSAPIYEGGVFSLDGDGKSAKLDSTPRLDLRGTSTKGKPLSFTSIT